MLDFLFGYFQRKNRCWIYQGIRCSSLRNSPYTPAYGTGYSVDRPNRYLTDRHAVRDFLARIHGNVPSRVRYPTPSLIIDLGTSLAPSADHPNDRARGERIGHCEADWYYRNGRHGRTDQTVG